MIKGHYVDKNTAAMFIPTFATSGNDLYANGSISQGQNFSTTATMIVKQATASGSKRLIIDVTGNGGGTITNAWDLFKLFFPDKFPYSATRWRRHTTMDGIALIGGVVNQSIAITLAQHVGWRGQNLPSQIDPVPSLDYFLNGGKH